ncbi:hypothetical protein D3C85_1605310 [compost metagenome]
MEAVCHSDVQLLYLMLLQEFIPSRFIQRFYPVVHMKFFIDMINMCADRMKTNG